MAETLAEVADPITTRLDLDATMSPAAVARRLAASAMPVEVPASPPAWLRLDQIAPFRRLLSAIEAHGGALLADPVGSGKSYVALAVAQHLTHREPAVALVPASLVAQWRNTAERLAVPLRVHSHEQVSRGRLPVSRTRFVIVDESHRFRNPGTRRYRELGQWMIGRRLLLLSATPIVNRLEDLGHQLLLGVRDDALAVAGVPSLLEALQGVSPPPALGQLVFCRAAPADRPAAIYRTLHWDPPAASTQLLAQIDALALSTDPGVAALIRVALWRALSSSCFALQRALERYQALLEHASHAGASGRQVTRTAIREFATAGLDQLVLWALLPEGGSADLVPRDREQLERLLAEVRQLGDPRMEILRRLLRDRSPTLVFTSSRDTLSALRQLDLDHHPAWVTGSSAGIGRTAMPRDLVLDWFRPGAGQPRTIAPYAPSVLLATDVAAEGLDLQRAERIVHVDLPWTSVRLDQREGRALRLGGARDGVEVWHFAAWPALEQRLGQEQRIVLKRRLATAAGLGDNGQWLFRWRSELQRTTTLPAPGVPASMAEPSGWLIGLAIDALLPDGSVQPRSADLLWLDDDGSVTDDPRVTVPLLERARTTREAIEIHPEAHAVLRIRLAPLVRARLQAGFTSQWQAGDTRGDRRRLGARLRQLARIAVQRRDRRLMQLTDHAAAWLHGGLTAGESAMVSGLATLAPSALQARLSRLSLGPRPRLIGVPRLTGAVRFIIPP